MKRSINTLVVLVTGLLAANFSLAGDVEDVIKFANEHLATQNGGDLKAHVAGHMPSISYFLADGGFLHVENSYEEQTKSLQPAFDLGIQSNTRIIDPHVNIYGNVAVLTHYWVGTNTLPGGRVRQIMNRRTAVLVKQGKEWKEVHTHTSPIVSPSAQ